MNAIDLIKRIELATTGKDVHLMTSSSQALGKLRDAWCNSTNLN
jgi:hypothetical protein